MALGDSYVNLQAMKSYLVGQANANFTGQDGEVADALASASREIERMCERQFNRTDTASPREYEPDGCRSTEVDDFHTTTDLVVKLDTAGDGSFARTLSASEYQLSPANGIVGGETGWPFYKLTLLGGLAFPTTLPGWTSAQGSFEVWGSGFLGNVASDGIAFLELDNGAGRDAYSSTLSTVRYR